MHGDVSKSGQIPPFNFRISRSQIFRIPFCLFGHGLEVSDDGVFRFVIGEEGLFPRNGIVFDFRDTFGKIGGTSAVALLPYSKAGEVKPESEKRRNEKPNATADRRRGFLLLFRSGFSFLRFSLSGFCDF